jgi:hypothetical protein
MSSILYYSNFCNHSKNIVQQLSKTSVSKDIHFICIDKRVKDENNKVYIILENGQRIIMPETLNRVPALLLLNNNYTILYGDNILNYLKPKQEMAIQESTNNNMEPSAFSISKTGFGIVSDQYSFLDMSNEELNAKGSGGLRQMHNYVDLFYSDKITTTPEETDIKSNKLSGEITLDSLQKQREQDFQNINNKRK